MHIYRDVDGEVALLKLDPEQVNPAMMFPDVFDASAAVAVVVPAGVFAVAGVPNAAASVCAAPENDNDPPDSPEGVPPAAVTTTLCAAPAATMIPHTCRNPDVIPPAWMGPDSEVIATALYVADSENPASLPVSSAHAASSTVFAPVTVCAHVSDVVVAVAPAADGPTASNASAIYGTVHRAYGGVASTSTQSAYPAALVPMVVPGA